jgi:hypothetical protein
MNWADLKAKLHKWYKDITIWSAFAICAVIASFVIAAWLLSQHSGFLLLLI